MRPVSVPQEAHSSILASMSIYVLRKGMGKGWFGDPIERPCGCDSNVQRNPEFTCIDLLSITFGAFP